jgi:hypothetical protein
MKGTLHKTEKGWVVKQLIKEGPNTKDINQYPLIDNGHIDGLKLYDDNEGLEVDFEIFDNREICNCTCHSNTDITHFVACCNNGYKTDNLGHVNYYAKLVDKATRPLTEDDAWPEYPEVKIICPRCKALMPCECNANWNVIYQEFIKDTDGISSLSLLDYLRDNYNPPTKKQDNDK